MRNGGLSITIGGIPADTLGYGQISGIEANYAYSETGGGLQSLSFSLALPRNFSHPVIRIGSPVQLSKAGIPLGSADLNDPDRDAWTFTCDGLYKRAEHFVAITERYVSGTAPPVDRANIAVVVAEANARGMGWNGTGNLPFVTITSSSSDASDLVYVSDVLNAYCAQNPGTRWGLDAANTPYVTTDPAGVSLLLAPGTPDIPTAADDYASTVFVKYATAVDAEGNATVTAFAPSTAGAAPLGVREDDADFTDLGVMTSTAATAAANTLAADRTARFGATASLAPAPGYLTTLGGVPVDGWRPVCGRRVRHFGVLTSDLQRTYGKTSEWVIGSATYRPGDDNELTIAPVGLLPRTLRDVHADIAAKLAKA